MYITKIIEKIEDIETAIKSIDELCNKMDKEGYSLVTYHFYDNLLLQHLLNHI